MYGISISNHLLYSENKNNNGTGSYCLMHYSMHFFDIYRLI